MLVHVYEVTRRFVVEVPDIDDPAIALSDAMQRVRVGGVKESPINDRLIAVQAKHPHAAKPLQLLLQRLISCPIESLAEVASAAGLPQVCAPTLENRGTWISDLLREARDAGRVSDLWAQL